jgi:cysteine desulfurase / selenocysteine lyase
LPILSYSFMDLRDSIPPFNVERLRLDFPILATPSNGKRLAYLDNGATTQKPQAVIEATRHFYDADNANIHRAVHSLAQRSTEAFEHARLKVQRFINAPDPAQIIFTRGTTEAINLVANSFGNAFVRAGDEIVISALEHHSNIVPWQLLCQRTGATLKVIPINDRGEVVLDELPKLLSNKTKLVAISHLSNSLGTIIDVDRVIREARAVGAKVLIDGAQWVGHFKTDVRALDCDFYVFSAHKLFGPTGVGVLYGKRELLEAMPPWQGGGDMIKTVSFEQSTWADLPNKFEAGTPDIAGVIATGAAIDYLNSHVDFAQAHVHEQRLLDRATQELRQIPGLRVIGTAPQKASVLSFVFDSPGLDPHTVGTLLDLEGVAVRTGHHCCMPVMTQFKLPGTIRASFSFYNTDEDVDQLVAGVKKIVSQLSGSVSIAPAPSRELVFQPAPPAAGLPHLAAAELESDFALFDNWDQKHEYLLDLGKKIAPMPAALKSDATKVIGCQSTVHLFARKKPGTTDTLEFVADSDAFIVRGLIALIEKVYSGQSSREILKFDIQGFFDRLGLGHHLSMGRRNGLSSIVDRVRSLAKSISGESA